MEEVRYQGEKGRKNPGWAGKPGVKLSVYRGPKGGVRGQTRKTHLHAAQPLADRQEGLLGCEVIHNNHTVGLSEELLTDTAISAVGEPLSGVCLPGGALG